MVQIDHYRMMVKDNWRNDYHFEGESFWRGMWYFQNMYVRLNGDYVVFTINNINIKVNIDDLLNKFLDTITPNRE